MIVTGQNGQAGTALVVPETQRLVITSAQNPRVRVVELDRTDIIQMTKEGKETTAEFVIPDFDFVIVTTRDQQTFRNVKIHTPDRSIVFFESVNHRSNAVIPPVRTQKSILWIGTELDNGSSIGEGHPWAFTTAANQRRKKERTIE
jgi:hypothetical protein